MNTKKFHKMMLKSKETLALAESCTGGLIAKSITDNKDSSKYFIGSVVTYSNKSKEILLKINKKTLKDFGAVSAAIAREMAIKILEILKPDIAVSITGIAGPGGGSKRKPKGLVYICVAKKNRILLTKNLFKGDRQKIRNQVLEKVFDLVEEFTK